MTVREWFRVMRADDWRASFLPEIARVRWPLCEPPTRLEIHRLFADLGVGTHGPIPDSYREVWDLFDTQRVVERVTAGTYEIRIPIFLSRPKGAAVFVCTLSKDQYEQYMDKVTWPC